MPGASVLFVIPAAPASLVEAVERNYGEFEDADGASPVDFLEANVGTVTSVRFEDCDDPVDAITGMAVALRGAATPYFAVSDSFTEPSRGMRCEGRVLLNLDGSPDGERQATHPWVMGEPDFSETTLRNAGFAESDVTAMVGTFFSPGPGFKR